MFVVRIKAQNDMLGFGLLSGNTELSEEEQVVFRGPQWKSYKWEMNEKWSKEEFLLEYDECSSSMYSNN